MWRESKSTEVDLEEGKSTETKQLDRGRRERRAARVSEQYSPIGHSWMIRLQRSQVLSHARPPRGKATARKEANANSSRSSLGRRERLPAFFRVAKLNQEEICPSPRMEERGKAVESDGGASQPPKANRLRILLHYFELYELLLLHFGGLGKQ